MHRAPGLVALVASTLVAVALAGCDDSGDGSGGAGSSSVSTAIASSSSGNTEAFTAYCDARAKLNCPGFTAAACKMQASCALPFLKDDVEASLFQCLGTSCDKDKCFLDTQQIPVSAAGQTLYDACNAWVPACNDPDTEVWCNNATYIADATLQEISDCIAPTKGTPSECENTAICLDDLSLTKFQSCSDWF